MFDLSGPQHQTQSGFLFGRRCAGAAARMSKTRGILETVSTFQLPQGLSTPNRFGCMYVLIEKGLL